MSNKRKAATVCHLFHRWTRWSKPSDGRQVIYGFMESVQIRTCERCGVVQQRRIWP